MRRELDSISLEYASLLMLLVGEDAPEPFINGEDDLDLITGETDPIKGDLVPIGDLVPGIGDSGMEA